MAKHHFVRHGSTGYLINTFFSGNVGHFQLQDIMGIDEKLRRENPHDEKAMYLQIKTFKVSYAITMKTP
jgi:hypothetical protein